MSRQYSSGHKQRSCYADGGKVEEPSLLDKAKKLIGVGQAKAGKAITDTAVKGVKNAPLTGDTLNAIEKHKKMLDEI